MTARRWKMARHRLRRLGQVGAREHRLLIEATLRLIVARVALAVVPFPRLARAMGGFVEPAQAAHIAARAAARPSDRETARQVGWAVTRAARHVPFAAVCLPQAIAAHRMLRTRHIVSVIHFGTARGETKSLKAHAWVDVQGVEVTGYPVAEDFFEIACLAA